MKLLSGEIHLNDWPTGDALTVSFNPDVPPEDCPYMEFQRTFDHEVFGPYHLVHKAKFKAKKR